MNSSLNVRKILLISLKVTPIFLKFKSTVRNSILNWCLIAVILQQVENIPLAFQKGIDEIVRYASVSEVLDFTSNDLIFLED
jgi:hypothetical protein